MRAPLLFAIVIALVLLPSCGFDPGRRVAEVGASIGRHVDVGVGITKSTDGWWYIGGKVRGKPGKGSDAIVEEGEPPFLAPLDQK